MSPERSPEEEVNNPDEMKAPVNIGRAIREFERMFPFAEKPWLKPQVINRYPEEGDRIIATMIFKPDEGTCEIIRYDDPRFGELHKEDPRNQ